MSRLARPSPAVRVFTPVCRMTMPAVPAMTAKPTAWRGLQRKDASEGWAEVDVRRRIHTGANTRRKVDGVMMIRKVSKKLKGKVVNWCVLPASTCGLETVALTEQQHRLQVCENNWIRKITSVKKLERRIKDLTWEEIESWQNNSEPDGMDWKHGQNERREITEKSWIISLQPQYSVTRAWLYVDVSNLFSPLAINQPLFLFLVIDFRN